MASEETMDEMEQDWDRPIEDDTEEDIEFWRID